MAKHELVRWPDQKHCLACGLTFDLGDEDKDGECNPPNQFDMLVSEFRKTLPDDVRVEFDDMVEWATKNNKSDSLERWLLMLNDRTTSDV